MLKRIIFKTKLAEERLFIALLKMIYFNLIKINKFIIYEFDLTKSFDAPSLEEPDWEIKIINYKEVEKYLPKGVHLPLEFKMHEIDGVEYCVVILSNNQIAHISWIYIRGDKNRFFDLRDNEAELNYCFTFPEYRGKGLFPQALLASVQWLKKEGFTKIFMAVHEGTIFMINSLKKVSNAKEIEIITHWCLYRPKFRPNITTIRIDNIVKTSPKILTTLKNYKKTAFHHYGHSSFSYLKFLYYSCFKINTFIIYENDLTKALPPYNLDPDFEVKKPTLKELYELREGKDLSREFYYDKILNVKTCYVVFHRAELAYIHWVFFKGDYSRFFQLSDGVTELNYNTTIPKFRGRRLSAKMMAYISKDLQDSGYKKVMGIIHEENIASIKCILQAGFREIGRIKALGPFHRKFKV